ncbi:hypothetical protein SADUNF_Sadunf19G0004300 [Salix dunnii]|uniref:Uncharacterized protein n=1 Tax=Salix dunnii TaxID=1413687 RepID=A0A835MES3_9ROSI|nr:hypothetical protein SADUNF_Sadunf19G0004300 [Salix dunnii]
MEGVPPSFMEDYVNQLEGLPSSLPEEVPVNQSSISCNDQAGQNMLVDDNVINDSFHQTTQFPTSFPQIMTEGAPPFFVDDNVSLTSNQLDFDMNILMSEFAPSFPQTTITMGGLDGTSSSWINQNGPNWPQTPSRSPQFPPHNLQVSGDHNQGQVDQASVIPHIENMQQESLMPLNFDRSTRSQMENLQVHVLQNQNARPNASNAGPHSSLQSQNRGLNTQQMEGVPPSFMEDYVNQLEGVPSLPLEEVPVNQSSMLCNDPAGQNMLVDNNDSTRQTTKFPPHNHQVSGDHDLLNSNCHDSMFFEPTSSSRQRQQGHVNMTRNTTASQHGGFNQPRPSLHAPRIQCIPNQGQVDQASVIPHIDNMQQENLMPRNSGKSTRSQMENLQVHVLQNQTARPNALNPGPDSSLQSQNRVLNTQQVVEAGVGEERISSHAVAGNDIVSMTGMRAQKDRVSEGALESRLMTEPVDRALEQSNLAGTAGRTQVGVQGTEQGAGEERIQSHSQAENAMEDTGEGSFRHDAFQTIPRTEQVQHLERRSS